MLSEASSIGKARKIDYSFHVMNSRNKRRFAAKVAFIAGILFMILGITFLLGSMENTSIVSVFIAFLLLLEKAFQQTLDFCKVLIG